MCGGRGEDCPETLLSLGNAMTINFEKCKFDCQIFLVVAQAPTFSSSQHAKVLEEVGARPPSQRNVCMRERVSPLADILEHIRTAPTTQVLLTAFAGAEFVNLLISKHVSNKKDIPQVRLSQ